MKFKIIKLSRVTSTNDVAINLIKNKKKETGFIYAENQTKGRGTYGKKWISKKGNLFSSVFFPLKKNYPSFNEFSIINPVIISNVIGHFCKRKKISLKWPNDIFVNGKKICGILQELITTNKKKFLIIGIGANLVSNPNVATKYKTTNILLESGKKISIKQFVYLTISSYEKFFMNLNSYKYTDFKKKADLMAIK